MLRGLLQRDVRLVVVGGVAANLFGSARVTKDLDICYEATNENIARLVSVLRAWNACLRGVEPGLPWVLDARAIRTNPVLTLIGDEGSIDVMDLVAGVGEYAACVERSVEGVWDDLKFRVISLDALIAAKRAAGRRKDHQDLLELEALREERRRRGL